MSFEFILPVGARGTGITGDQREFKGHTERDGLSGGVQSNLIDVFVGIVGIDAPDA